MLAFGLVYIFIAVLLANMLHIDGGSRVQEYAFAIMWPFWLIGLACMGFTEGVLVGTEWIERKFTSKVD